MSHIAIARIRKEKKLMKENKSHEYTADTTDNIFEWHFTLRGPIDTPYEKGIYHGKIVLPHDYPMNPPDIYFFTVNGRFEVNTKLCLTNTSFHKEEWSTSWTIENIIQGISSMMPIPTPGAIGSIETPDDKVREMALQSHSYKCPKCGEIRKIIKPRI